MSQLNELERAVLLEICRRTLNEGSALEQQCRSATVLTRTNTGVGFYTSLKVEDPKIRLVNRVFPDVFAAVDCLRNPMVFVLFAKNGVIHKLEGASIDDSTSSVDFSSVNFTILSD